MRATTYGHQTKIVAHMEEGYYLLGQALKLCAGSDEWKIGCCRANTAMRHGLEAFDDYCLFAKQNNVALMDSRHAAVHMLHTELSITYGGNTLSLLEEMRNENGDFLPPERAPIMALHDIARLMATTRSWPDIRNVQRAQIHTLRARVYKLLGEFFCAPGLEQKHMEFSRNLIPKGGNTSRVEDTRFAAMHEHGSSPDSPLIASMAEYYHAEIADGETAKECGIDVALKELREHPSNPDISLQDFNTGLQRVDLGSWKGVWLGDKTLVAMWGLNNMRMLLGEECDFGFATREEMREVVMRYGLEEAVEGRLEGYLRFICPLPSD
ncbi:hypothetical protein OHC33_005535 [Knufia fluminis]|uniref:Uncharacterized protein n=1 Tax=Knufia fluminis TaxID=191047 RepID=A0AAN8F914_9EURO|nr:hypothetical protein OHC33_005535 [Knufia fluminis]